MTICPIAIAVGCKKCPAFNFCPLTTVLGDQTVGAWEEDLPTADEHLDKTEDEYQKYAEEELEKNTKQMESFKGEDAEVIPERNKMKKEESGKE
ncbi:hypothetical protein M1M85_01810 [Nitrospinaceae bacterium]|nr:hypothetical protein [Nitrospinaceae bacterium]